MAEFLPFDRFTRFELTVNDNQDHSPSPPVTENALFSSLQDAPPSSFDTVSGNGSAEVRFYLVSFVVIFVYLLL